MPLTYPLAERTLDNGLRVVVSEDHSVPTVAVNIWVNVGSRHERPGRTGLAHLFEHLMFEGSRNVAPGEHFRLLMAHGARLNATTSFDRTNYFETLPKGVLDLALWLEADRHGYLLDAVTQANLDNQRDVVKEEKRQRYDNAPYGDAYHLLFDLLFPDGHPYQHPTIGSMEDLDAANLDDVHAFFRAHYSPANSVLTLVGDLTSDEGFAAAERYLGVLPGPPVVQPPPTPPPGPVAAPVHAVHDADVPADRIYSSFRLPKDNTAEYLACACAIDVLGGLFTSRLERGLVRGEELCNAVYAGAHGLVDNVSVGTLILEAAAGVGLELIEERLCAELTRLADDGPTDIELETVLAQSERSWLSTLAAMEDRADLLGQFTTLYGDPQLLNTYLDEVAAVTAADVAAAADRWLRPEHRTVLTYRSPADTKGSAA